jgi:hypothetical protein
VQAEINAAQRLEGLLSVQIPAARRAAAHSGCPQFPCTTALEHIAAPALLAGQLAQARLLASTLSAQVSPRALRALHARPTLAFLKDVSGTPSALARQLGRIGARSVEQSLAAGSAIIHGDHSLATRRLVGLLRSQLTIFTQAGRRGVGLPLASLIGGAASRRTHRAPTEQLVRFGGFPDGTSITTQTAAAGASFGSPQALGFAAAPPVHVCSGGPTVKSGVAVAPDCLSSVSGLRDTGLLARLTLPARAVSVSIGTSQAQPGGFAADIRGFDASGNVVAQNAVLVGSSTNGQAAGPVQSVKAQVFGSIRSIAYIALYFDGSFPPGPRLVFDNLAYIGP